MKLLGVLFSVIVMTSQITGCGTIGGAVHGAGNDLQRAGDWIKNR